MQSVIIRPIVTEKSMGDVNKSKYSFLVVKDATKSAIKQAVKQMFSVTVIGVQTSITKGRKQRVGARRAEVPMADFKKAIVTLKKGDTIALLEPAGEEKKK